MNQTVTTLPQARTLAWNYVSLFPDCHSGAYNYSYAFDGDKLLRIAWGDPTHPEVVEINYTHQLEREIGTICLCPRKNNVESVEPVGLCQPDFQRLRSRPG
jgi:hypothetical protein